MSCCKRTGVRESLGTRRLDSWARGGRIDVGHDAIEDRRDTRASVAHPAVAGTCHARISSAKCSTCLEPGRGRLLVAERDRQRCTAGFLFPARKHSASCAGIDRA